MVYSNSTLPLGRGVGSIGAPSLTSRARSSRKIRWTTHINLFGKTQKAVRVLENGLWATEYQLGLVKDRIRNPTLDRICARLHIAVGGGVKDESTQTTIMRQANGVVESTRKRTHCTGYRSGGGSRDVVRCRVVINYRDIREGVVVERRKRNHVK